MSEWYETDILNDIDIDKEAGEVNIYVTHNDFGAIYKTLSFGDVRDIYNELPVEGK